MISSKEDLFNKYLKYKSKYLKLKNNMKGGAFFTTSKTSNKFTKEEYDALSQEDKDKFPFYCPSTHPHLCTLSTPNFGLCKKNQDECSVYTGENKYLIYDLESNDERKANLEYGEKFGYTFYKQKDKNCSNLIENSYGNITNFEGPHISNPFKILTWNLWWSIKKETSDEAFNKFNIDFFKTRMDSIVENIIKSNADIICLQEVGDLTFKMIYDESRLKILYPYYYENPISWDKDNTGQKKRTIDTVCLSKYPAKSFGSYGVEGNLEYHNSMCMVEFEKFVVFNVYLQAGTRNSPGQKDLWFNYSRCRYNEYLLIKNYIESKKIEKPIIILGDFNTDLNGSVKNWPELKAFNQMNLQDAWLEKYDNKSGFTENTSINLMRWNVKFEEKIFRIDGIFYTKDAFNIKNIEVFGTDPIDISTDLEDNFVKYRVPNKENKNELLRKNQGRIQFWPSDHFGVLAEIKIK